MLGVRARSVLLSAMMLLVGQMLLIQNYAPQPSVLDEFVETRSDTTHNGNGTAWMVSDFGGSSTGTPLIWMSR